MLKKKANFSNDPPWFKFFLFTAPTEQFLFYQIANVYQEISSLTCLFDLIYFFFLLMIKMLVWSYFKIIILSFTFELVKFDRANRFPKDVSGNKKYLSILMYNQNFIFLLVSFSIFIVHIFILVFSLYISFILIKYYIVLQYLSVFPSFSQYLGYYYYYYCYSY